MKKILTLLCVSALGGALTLGVYKQFLEKPSIPKVTENQPTATLFPVNLNTNLNGGTNVDFTTAANKTVHSVVHVKNTSISSGSSSVWDYFNNNRSNRTRIGMGSGVIISKDGYIITNNHVIENASTIEVTTNNNKTYQAELIGKDEISDIAVLKIDSEEK